MMRQPIVSRSHEGNEPLADARDGLDTTEYDHGDEHCDDERYGPFGIMGKFPHMMPVIDDDWTAEPVPASRRRQ